MHENQELKQQKLPQLPQLPEAWAESETTAEQVYNLFVIIDCAQMERTFYDAVKQDQRLQSKTLFAGTAHEESAAAGPLLVQIDLKNAPDFVQNLQALEKEKPRVIWLWTELPFAGIFPKLKSLLFGENEDHRKFFFRYFDPRNLEEFLEIFRDVDESVKVLKTIRGWAFLRDGKYVLLKGGA